MQLFGFMGIPHHETLDKDGNVLTDCFEYAKDAENKKIVVLRLWNNGGKDSLNDKILNVLENYFPKPWVEERNGTRIGEKIYIQYGDKFDWPTLNNNDIEEKVFCYGLRDQLGVLADGTVVPCCLDHAGAIPLGNLFEQSLDEVMASPRARAIYDGFTRHVAVEPLCRRCGYAAVIKKLLVRGKE